MTFFKYESTALQESEIRACTSETFSIPNRGMLLTKSRIFSKPLLKRTSNESPLSINDNEWLIVGSCHEDEEALAH